MLSTKAIGSVGQASHYFFNKDDYYSKEGKLYEKPSVWYGKGAELLGLNGNVNKKQFGDLLSGKLPNGEQIGLMKNGEIKHRAGFDLTFSAPKSWSMASFITKDPIFDKIFEESVKFTLDLIERDCAMSNVYKDKQQNMAKTGNLVMSLHFHKLSRAVEPQTHIHSVINNITQREDGSWRALKSDNPLKTQHEHSEGFLERINATKKDYGAIQRMQQAYLATKAGFALEKTGETFWELKHVSKEMCDEFSTRSHQIRDDMTELGVTGGKAAALSNLRTRSNKSKMSKDEIAAAINARLTKFPEKITIESLKQTTINHTTDNINHEQQQAKIAIDYAINHLTETMPSFTTTKLLSVAMQHNFAKAGITSLIAAIDDAKSVGSINLINRTNGDSVYTSSSNINIETKLLEQFNNSKNSGRGIVKSDGKFDKWQKKYAPELTQEQRTSVYSVMRSKDKINSIDGPVSSGKSHLITILSKMSDKSWYNTVVLTVSSKDTMDLKTQINKEVKTVASYLKQTEIKENQLKGKFNLDGQVLIIDGSHRLNTKQHEQLTKLASEYNARIIHLFDSRAPENFAPGNAMQLLKDAGLNIAQITKIVGCRSPNIITIKEEADQMARQQQIAKDYVHYKKNEPHQKVQIIGQDKHSTDKLNNLVQSELNVQNLLGKKWQHTIYTQKYLSAAQTKLAGCYKKDDLVTFSKSYVSLNVKKDTFYKIIGIDREQNTITLKDFAEDNNNVSNKAIIWNPDKLAGGRAGVVKTFAVVNKSFYENDKIVITQNSKTSTLLKGNEFNISKIDNNKIELKNDSCKTFKLSINDKTLNHIDLAYAKTATQSYNDKPDIVLAEQLAYKRQTNIKQFYKAIAQSYEQIKIYTDNKPAYIETLKKHNGKTKPIIDILLSTINNSVANVIIDSQVATKDKVDPIMALITSMENAKNNVIKKQGSLSKLYDKTLNGEPVDSKKLTHLILKHCINEISNKEAVFTRFNLEKNMAKEASRFNHQIDMSKIDNAIDKELTKHKLYQCKLYDDIGYTTPRAVKLESKIVNFAKSTINSGYQFSDVKATKEHLKNWQENNSKLSSSQVSAIKAITTTKNSLILVNGLAGVGKTTMLSAIKPLCDTHNIKMIGLAPTNAATNEIKDKGIESYTLDSYLGGVIKAHKEKSIDPTQKTLLILDESSMASTQKIHNLLALTKETNTRLAFVGDVAQLPAVEQGKMFWFLQKIGIETTHVKDIIRQKNSPEYLALVHKTYQGDFKEVLNTMEKRGLAYDHKVMAKDNQHVDFTDNEAAKFARISFMVDKLMQKSSTERANTRIVTSSNEDRKIFNKLYRRELQNIGEVGQKEVSTTILNNSNLTKEQISEAINYNVNQVVKFNSSIPNSNIKKDDYLTITDINFKNNYLILTNNKHNDRNSKEENPNIALNLSQFKGINAWKLTVFDAEQRSIANGDAIRWRLTDKANGRINMDEAKVIAVDNQKAIVADKNGKTHEINFNNFKDGHWDHAYAGTAYTEQGKTAKHVAILMSSQQAKLASQPAFLVALTRAAKDGFIVCDDLVQLGKRLEINSGVKTGALESLGYKNINEKNKSKNNCYNDLTNNKRQSKNLNIKQGKASLDNKSVNHHIVNNYNARDIAKMLSLDTSMVAIHLLGKPVKKNGLNLFFGSNKGSLAVTISGKYKGTYKDFDTGAKGTMINLIQQELGLTFREALEYAAKLVNYKPDIKIIDHVKNKGKQEIKTAHNNGFSEQQLKQIKFAQKLAGKAINIKGTLAEKYLKNTRGIKLDSWSNDVKFHPGIYSKLNQETNPALLVIARGIDNNVQAVQAIYLNKDTAQKADIEVKKQTFGVLKGALFCANTNKNQKNTAIICEGPEDALALTISDSSKTVFSCLGKSNFANVTSLKMTEFKDIILALDNDGKSANQMPDIIAAAKNLQTPTNNVWLAQPSRIKEDYNDILKSAPSGAKLVNNIINNAINLKDCKQEFNIDCATFGDRVNNTNQAITKTNITSTISSNTNTNDASNNVNKLQKIKEKEL